MSGRQRFPGVVGVELCFHGRCTQRRQPPARHRIERKIRDLLDYTRARGPGIPIQREPTNLFELCKQNIDSMEQLHPTRRFRLEVEGDVQGEWDRERVLQLVSNLLSNAVKFGREGTPITAALKDLGDQVELAVHNQGAFIPPETVPRLFERFVRGDGPAATADQGLGLGLFIVKQIVLGHGGTVDVRSDDTEGTILTVRLPHRP